MPSTPAQTPTGARSASGRLFASLTPRSASSRRRLEQQLQQQGGSSNAAALDVSASASVTGSGRGSELEALGAQMPVPPAVGGGGAAETGAAATAGVVGSPPSSVGVTPVRECMVCRGVWGGVEEGGGLMCEGLWADWLVLILIRWIAWA